MSCPVCGADVEQGVYHTRPDNLAACPGKTKADDTPAKPARKPRSKK